MLAIANIKNKTAAFRSQSLLYFPKTKGLSQVGFLSPLLRNAVASAEAAKEEEGFLLWLLSALAPPSLSQSEAGGLSAS